MMGRHVLFSRDGILRIGSATTLVPALSLCGDAPDQGIPWWMAVLPVSIEAGTDFRHVLRCLRPWQGSIARDMGVDLGDWDEVLSPLSDTPRLIMMMEVHSDLDTGDRWNAFVRGTRDEDFGNPDEMPFDILGACEARISGKRLLLSASDGAPPIIDAGHPGVFLTWPWGKRKSVGAWAEAGPPGFSDFVCNCLLSTCLPHGTPSRTASRILANS